MRSSTFCVFLRSAPGCLAIWLLTLVLGTLALSATPAIAANVYGSDDSTPSYIFNINTTNGAFSVAGRLALPSFAIALNPVDSQVYYIENTGNGRFGRWNPVADTNTIIGNTGTNAVFIRLAFRSDGTLYGMGSDTRLFTINTATGAATSLGTVSGIEGSRGDLEFGPDDTLYLIEGLNSRLYSLNVSTLTATLIGSVGFPRQAGLVFADGVLYSAYDKLIQIDTGTGAGNLIASFPSFLNITDLTRGIPLTAAIGADKTVTPGSTAAGGTVTYTITVSNSGGGSGLLNEIRDVLPDGFTYVPGSTTGLTTADPVINGQILTWNDNWAVPRQTGGIDGTVTLTFDATAGSVSGTFYNNVTVSGSNFATVTTGAGAPVTVIAPLMNLTKFADRANGQPGDEIIYAVQYRNLGDGEARTLIIMDTIPVNTTYVSGSLQIGSGGSVYDDPGNTVPTDTVSDDAGEINGTSVIFNISVVAPDDGVPNSGPDEGIVYFKVRID